MNATIKVQQDEETGSFVASWDDPRGGGITTQADTLEELDGAVREAIRCHFANRTAPRKVVRDRVLEKFDRGEDVFEFCDMSAGVMKVPLD